MADKGKKKKWWKQKEFWGTLLLTGKALTMFPDHTVANDAGGYILWSIPVFAWMGLVDGYQSDNLPEPITKIMDKLPSGLTGEKGRKKIQSEAFKNNGTKTN